MFLTLKIGTGRPRNKLENVIKTHLIVSHIIENFIPNPAKYGLCDLCSWPYPVG